MNETFPSLHSEEAIPLSIKGLSERGGDRRFTHTEADEDEEETFDLLSTEGLEEVRTLTKEAFIAQERVRDGYTAFDFRVLEDVYQRLQESLLMQRIAILEGNTTVVTERAPSILSDIKDFIELLELRGETEEEEVVVFEDSTATPEEGLLDVSLNGELRIAAFVERYPGGFGAFENAFGEFVAAVDPSGVRDTVGSFHALAPLTVYDVREMTSPWNESDKDDFLAAHQLTQDDIEPWFAALGVWKDVLQHEDEQTERFETVARIAFIEHLKRAV
jgi:hypothetical protein